MPWFALACLQVETGGWDQDQFGYWGKKMAGNISSTTLSTNAVVRSQNNYASMDVARLDELLR